MTDSAAYGLGDRDSQVATREPNRSGTVEIFVHAGCRDFGHEPVDRHGRICVPDNGSETGREPLAAT
jgi:hypothetical protein